MWQPNWHGFLIFLFLGIGIIGVPVWLGNIVGVGLGALAGTRLPNDEKVGALIGNIVGFCQFLVFGVLYTIWLAGYLLDFPLWVTTWVIKLYIIAVVLSFNSCFFIGNPSQYDSCEERPSVMMRGSLGSFVAWAIAIAVNIIGISLAWGIRVAVLEQ